MKTAITRYQRLGWATALLFVFSTTVVHADPDRLPGVTVIGSLSSSSWGYYSEGHGGGAPGTPTWDELAPEPSGAPELLVSNKHTDTRCANIASNGLDAVTSRDDATQRELAANSAANRLKAAYAARSIVAIVMSWLDGNGGFKVNDILHVVFADGGSADYTIQNPSAGSNTLAPGSEANLVQGDGVVRSTTCAA